MTKIRIDVGANYKGIFFNGKTVRQRLDPTCDISATLHPEIEDIGLNTACFAACSYCYTSATKVGKNFDRIVEKAHEVWGTLPENDRPFQIAIGGSGESTIHSDWAEFVKEVKGLGIMPNYTTNGMHLKPEILKATSDYCGGVAVSYHPHIPSVFPAALKKLATLKQDGIKLNAHVIVGDEQSLKDCKDIFKKHLDELDYLVILPYQAAGRAVKIKTHKTWGQLFKWISSMDVEHQKKFAFGALFYDYMCKNEIPLKIDKYPPEIYSGYRMMDDSYMTLRKSSYDLSPKVVKRNTVTA